MKFINKKIITGNKYVSHIGILISLILVIYLAVILDLQAAWSILITTPVVLILSLTVIYMSSFYFRSVRWKYMLLNEKEISIKILSKSILLGFAGNNILPMRGGELLRMEYFSRKTELSRFFSITSILIEKILDVFVLLLILLLSGYLLKIDNPIITHLTYLVSIFFLSIMIVLFIIKMKGDLLMSIINVKYPRLEKLSRLLENVYSALKFFKNDFRTFLVIVNSILIWILEGIVFSIVFWHFDLVQYPIFVGFLTLCILNFSILIPSSPGYIGVFQGAIILSLSLFGVQNETSLAVALLIHSIQFIPVTLIGIGIFSKETIQFR